MADEPPAMIPGRPGSTGPPVEADVAFPSADGTGLRGRSWSVPAPRAVLVIAHGLGEHGGSYRRTAEVLGASADVDILAFDFRGGGRSPGRRGVVRRYDDLTSDLVAALGFAARERPGLPRFLLGHSNGGLVAIRAMLGGDRGLAGLILSNPLLRLSARVPPWKRAVGEFLRVVAPGVTLPTGLTNEQLTRDPDFIAGIEADPLRHGRISPPLFFGMRRSGPEALARAGEIRLPTLMILGADDTIIDPASGRLFFDRLSSRDKTLKVYINMRHEPLNELGRDVVLADVAGWLRGRTGR